MYTSEVQSNLIHPPSMKILKKKYYAELYMTNSNTLISYKLHVQISCKIVVLIVQSQWAMKNPKILVISKIISILFKTKPIIMVEFVILPP